MAALGVLLFGGLFHGLERGFFGGGFAAASLFLRVHRSAASLCATVAESFVFAAVIEAVVVGNLLAGGNVPDGLDPDAAVHFAGLAVGVATMVDEHGRTVAVDDDGTVTESKEIGNDRVLVAGIGLLFAQAAAGVFGHARALADGGGGVAAGGVDGGGADDESHANVRCFPLAGICLYGPHPNIDGFIDG